MALFIATTVQWVILPFIMFAIFALAWIIASSAKNAELRVSSWAGFWAGMLSFLVYVVSQLGQIREPELRYVPLPGLQLLPLGWGLTAGFVFLWVVRHAVPTRLVGLITLLLTGTSTSALFTYVFIDSLKVSVLYWTLGTALGILLHIVLFPASVVHIFPRARERNASWPMPCGCRWRSSSPRQEQQPPAPLGQGSGLSIPGLLSGSPIECRTLLPDIENQFNYRLTQINPDKDKIESRRDVDSIDGIIAVFLSYLWPSVFICG
jgi:hypothetical protein